METKEENLLLECATLGILEGKRHAYIDNHRLDTYLDWVSENPALANKTALTDDETGRTLTFGQLSQVTSALGRILRREIGNAAANGNPDGDTVVGVCLPPSGKLVVCLYAIMKAGGAYVPLETSFPENRIQMIVDTAKPMILIAQDTDCARRKLECVRERVKILLLDDLWKEMENGKEGEDDADMSQGSGDHESTAVILFTSGSSGVPKGVRISHRAVFNRLHWNWVEIPYSSDWDMEQCCWKTSLTFVDSLPEIFGSILRGISLVVFARDKVSQPHVFMQLLEKYAVSRVILVPSFLRSILTVIQLEKSGGSSITFLSSVRNVISSGESLPLDVLEKFFEAFPKGKNLYNVYGSTEMGDISFECFSSLEDVKRKCVRRTNSESLQAPLGPEICHNTKIFILDDKLEIVQEGQMGEIYSTGHNLAKGYVGIKESDKFIQNAVNREVGYETMYRTGDFGEIQKNSLGKKTLVYHGRFDTQIKVRGHRIDLQEVEENLKMSSMVKQGIVLCYHPGLEDQAVVAFVVPVEGVDVTAIEKDVASRLLAYQMPKIVIIDDFPYLVNGKIDRQALLRQFEIKKDSEIYSFDWVNVDVPEKDSVSFRTLIETIAEIGGTPVKTVMENLDKSFFDVGGTSLNSLGVVARLRELGYVIGISEFIGAPSVREVYLRLETGTFLQGESRRQVWLEDKVKNLYDTEVMTAEHTRDVIHLFSISFATKGDLERWLPGATYEEFSKWMKTIWDELIVAPYSYVVRRKSDRSIVAAAVNYDDTEEPENTHGGNWDLTTICEFISTYEDPFRDALPQGKGKLLQNFMTGTAESISAAENVILMQFMEEENIKVGKRHNFEGMMTTNTNLLTQEIAKNHAGYKILCEAKLNAWTNSVGQRPFEKAPDSQTIQICYIDLSMFI